MTRQRWYRFVPAAVSLALAAVVTRGAEAPPLVVRHTHRFVVVNTGDTPPVITLISRPFHTYADALAADVWAPEAVLRRTVNVALGKEESGPIPGPAAPLYLVEARPGMNGVVFLADRPWGVAADEQGLGTNGAVPALYLYVPEGCTALRARCQAGSPNEGARVSILRPDGAEAHVFDGELDSPETAEIPVPQDGRGKVWAVTWERSRSVPAALDDVVLALDGRLAALLWPERSWAETLGPVVWARHRAAMGWE